MAVVELAVRGMTCAHCARAVTEGIRARDPAARVEVALDQGRVRAETALPPAEVAAAIAAAGYELG